MNLLNFIEDSQYNEDEGVLQEKAAEVANKILSQYITEKPAHSSVLVRKKEIVEGSTPKVLSSALFEFDNVDTTIENYEKVRKGIINEKDVRVRLFFHKEEANSYLSLITQGLSKPEGQTEKQF